MGGAIPGTEFLAMLRESGFEEVEMVSETGLKSSPATVGMLFKAKRPGT
jgi:hypothetical protein